MTSTGFLERAAAALGWIRRRCRWLDQVIRAGIRYDSADGGRLAAAVTYYAFFAVFGLALLGLAVLGYVLDDPAVLRSVQRYLAQNLPRLDAQALREVRDTLGVIALIGLPVTGLFWVDSLRSSIRAIWRVDQYPGSFFVRQLVDLLVLVGLAVLLGVSLAVAFGTNALVNWLVVDAAGADPAVARWLLGAVGFVLGIAVNTLLSIAVLTGLPRLRMPLRRVVGPAVLIAVGLELLKTVGRLYLERTEANPAYHVVTGAVGLLVFLSLLNQLILFAAALTATSGVGRVVDLAAGPPRRAPSPAAELAGVAYGPARRRRGPYRSWSVPRWPDSRLDLADHRSPGQRTVTCLAIPRRCVARCHRRGAARPSVRRRPADGHRAPPGTARAAPPARRVGGDADPGR